MNWLQADEFLISSQALTACQSFSTQPEASPTLSGRAQGCKQQLSAKQNHPAVCVAEQVYAATGGAQMKWCVPSHILPSHLPAPIQKFQTLLAFTGGHHMAPANGLSIVFFIN